MKKVLLVSALVLVIATSMVSGTLAVYTLTIPTVASGSVMAKNFILTGKGESDFKTNVLIAPKETVKMNFTVANSDGTTTAEVPMDLAISIKLGPDGVKPVITPLTVVVKKGGTVVATSGSIVNGVGTLTVADELTNIAAGGESKTYTVEITWPDTASDTTFAGNTHGTALTVSVTGTQK